MATNKLGEPVLRERLAVMSQKQRAWILLGRKLRANIIQVALQPCHRSLTDGGHPILLAQSPPPLHINTAEERGRAERYRTRRKACHLTPPP
jgi:hypothetical protein